MFWWIHMSAKFLGTRQKLISLNIVKSFHNFCFQVAEMGLPGCPFHLPSLPALLPAVEGDHPRCRVVLPGGHHTGLHLPRPRGGDHAREPGEHRQPAQFPDGQPETAARVAASLSRAGMLRLAAQQHQQVAAARPFMCAQPVLAIQTPAFMVASSKQRAAAALERNDAAANFCSLPSPHQHCPGSDNAKILESTKLSMQSTPLHITASVRRNPYFGCNEAHSDLTWGSLHCMGLGLERSVIKYPGVKLYCSRGHRCSAEGILSLLHCLQLLQVHLVRVNAIGEMRQIDRRETAPIVIGNTWTIQPENICYNC